MKTQFALTLYTKSRFRAMHFRLDNIYLKGRGLKTVSVGATNLVSKVAKDLKRKKSANGAVKKICAADL